MNSYHLGAVVRLRGVIAGNKTNLKAEAAAGALTIQVYRIANYANSDPVVINPGGQTEEFGAVSGTPTGTTITLAAALKHRHGVGEVVREAAAPTVVCTVKLPDGTTSTPANSVVSGETGAYEADFTTTQTGRHRVQLAASGTVVATIEWEFTVLASEI